MKFGWPEIRSFLLIFLGIFSAGMGLKGFLLSSRFIVGGVTGISMLIAEIFGVGPLANGTSFLRDILK